MGGGWDRAAWLDTVGVVSSCPLGNCLDSAGRQCKALYAHWGFSSKPAWGAAGRLRANRFRREPLRRRPEEAEREAGQQGIDHAIHERAHRVGPGLPLPDRIAQVRDSIGHEGDAAGDPHHEQAVGPRLQGVAGHVGRDEGDEEAEGEPDSSEWGEVVLLFRLRNRAATGMSKRTGRRETHLGGGTS